MPSFRTLVAALALCTLGASAQAPGDIRIALVIGNSAYPASPLLNPANDARAMTQTLKGLGFEVIEVRDGSKAQMAEAVAKVRDVLKGKQGVGMLYYAGHGLQVDLRNYMIPVDAKMKVVGDVPVQGVDVGSVIDAFKLAGNRMNIIVLDACRDNPFGGATTGRGLAPLDAPSGTFLAYATAPGNVAEDGDASSGNGLYTQYLLLELKKPMARIEDVFKRVRFAVRKASSGRQIPWESTSLEEDFQFNDGRVVAMPKPTVQQQQAEYSGEKQDWERIKDSVKPDDFYAFLQKYPSGPITEAAHARLNVLSRPTLVVQSAATGVEGTPYVISAYRVGDVFEKQMAGMTLTERVVRKTSAGVEVETQMTMPGVPGIKPTLSVYDAQGGIISVDTGQGVMRQDPPQYYAPAGLLQVGRQWKIGVDISWTGNMANIIGAQVVTGQGRVAAREMVTVPAGTFNAFRVEWETHSVATKGQVNDAKCVSWHVPELPTSIKMSCDIGKGPSSLGELVKVTRGA